MKDLLLRFAMAIMLIAAAGMSVFGQGGGTSSSLLGTVVDSSGGVMPGVEVAVKNNATGTEAKVITAENGTFLIPSLSPGTYTASVAMTGFKQAIYQDIVLVAGQPSTVRIIMQVGGSSETVVVVAGTEMVQTASATVVQTLSTTQILSLPSASRDLMDFITMLPGVNTTAGARGSTFAGMPGSSVNITVDGMNSQDGSNKEGFWSFISPRQDAMQEVTVSTATPGAESSGSGAVQVKFVTRQGNSNYQGSLYWYHRNPALNTNYWFNNRDRKPLYEGSGEGQHFPCTPAQLLNEWSDCKAPKDRVLFNQEGGRLGGPIVLPKKIFGPLGFNGKDRAFFFFNYELFHLPAEMARTRTMYNPLVDSGNYVYLYKKSGQPDEVRSVNLLTLAGSNGQLSTWDPTVQKMLGDVRNSINCPSCTIQSYPVVSDPLYQSLIFSSKEAHIRKFPTARFDFNLTNKHRLEGSWNFVYYDALPDNFNGYDARFPGFPSFGGQISNRHSTTVTLRSTLTPKIVNEGRAGFGGGTITFGSSPKRVGKKRRIIS